MAFMAWLLLTLACAAQAQDAGAATSGLRKEAVAALTPIQDAVKAGRHEEALRLLAPVRSRTDLNDAERAAAERLQVAAALALQQYSNALPALEYLVQAPALSPAERLKFLDYLLGASVNAKDFARVVRWARACLQSGCPAERAHIWLVQSLALLQQYAAVVAEMKQTLAQADASGSAPPQEELRALASSQLQLKDKAGYVATLRRLLRHYPHKDYWADLLARSSAPSPRLELDLMRLVRASGNLTDADQVLEMAALAQRAGLPAEALSVLQQAYQDKTLPGSRGADAERALQAAQKASDEDKADLAARKKAAQTGAQWAGLAEVLASNQQWAAANEAFANSLALGGLRREAETRLHYGISLYNANAPDKAKQQWQQAGGDTQAIAELWLLMAR